MLVPSTMAIRDDSHKEVLATVGDNNIGSITGIVTFDIARTTYWRRITRRKLLSVTQPIVGSDHSVPFGARWYSSFDPKKQASRATDTNTPPKTKCNSAGIPI